MATLTLKNVPQETVDRLKDRAVAHRRSLNQEAIATLEGALRNETPEELLEQSRRNRERMAAAGIWVTEAEVDRWIAEGRK